MAASKIKWVIGVDPGLRNTGVAIYDGRRVLYRTTIHTRGESWVDCMQEVLDRLDDILVRWDPDVGAVEGVVWHGKRRGSLQLAHLAGAIYGYLASMPGCGVRLLLPADVKAESRGRNGATAHEADAAAAARILYRRLERAEKDRS